MNWKIYEWSLNGASKRGQVSIIKSNIIIIIKITHPHRLSTKRKSHREAVAQVLGV